MITKLNLPPRWAWKLIARDMACNKHVAPLALSHHVRNDEFARRVTVVEKLKTAQRLSLVELDALFASLQHRAFHGEMQLWLESV